MHGNRSPTGRGGGRASAALPLLDDVTTSPASRRLASARPALAPKCQLILARTLSNKRPAVTTGRMTDRQLKLLRVLVCPRCRVTSFEARGNVILCPACGTEGTIDGAVHLT